MEYLDTFKFIPRADFALKFPGCSTEAVDFLNKMLVFNPHFRMTLEDAIKHPFLDNVRTDKSTKWSGSNIDFQFDKIDLTKDQLRALFLSEIHFY